MPSRLPAWIVEQTVLPVIAAPMFLVSGPDLVIAACREGVIGAFPTLNARTPEILEEWLARITGELERLRAEDPGRRIAPWAVNLIVHRTNARLEADLERVVRYRAPIVITSLGNPAAVVEAVHGYGGLVFSDVVSLTHARKAAQAGVDGLVLVGAGAGGHGGTITGFAFVEAVRDFFDGIVVLAGGIATGRGIAAAQALGADLVYMGTRFIATTESMAPDAYRQMLVEATVEDIVYTDAFSGVPANMLKPSIRRAGLDPDNLQGKGSFDVASIQAKAWKDIWSAGHGVGAIKEVLPVADLVRKLRREYDEALAALRAENPWLAVGEAGRAG